MNQVLLLLVALVVGCVVRAQQSEYKPQIRTYYIAAEEVLWNYVPSAPFNLMKGANFTDAENVFVANGPNRIGHIYKKALYFEYTDITFNVRKERAPEWEHLGVLGPLIRGVVGDTIVVHFYNKATIPYSIHPHGVKYPKSSEGVDYYDGDESRDGVVQPGSTYIYTWEVPVRAGPDDQDPNSIMWLYHSHTNEVADTNAGLIGPLVITSAAAANVDATPKFQNALKEFVIQFSIYDENMSHYLKDNIAMFTNISSEEVDAIVADPDFVESNLKHNMNGYLYGNLGGLTMKVGDNVRWYLTAMGTEVDLHTAHWHGATVTQGGHRVDVINLLPAWQTTTDMIPDEVGVWMFHCHVNDHILAGMSTKFNITEADPSTNISSANFVSISYALVLFITIMIGM